MVPVGIAGFAAATLEYRVFSVSVNAFALKFAPTPVPSTPFNLERTGPDAAGLGAAAGLCVSAAGLCVSADAGGSFLAFNAATRASICAAVSGLSPTFFNLSFSISNLFFFTGSTAFIGSADLKVSCPLVAFVSVLNESIVAFANLLD